MLQESIEEFFSNGRTHASAEARMPLALRDIHANIRTFFENKAWHLGGGVPDELLYTKRNFHLMNNIPLIDAVTLAYDSIEEIRRQKFSQVWDNVRDGFVELDAIAFEEVYLKKKDVGLVAVQLGRISEECLQEIEEERATVYSLEKALSVFTELAEAKDYVYDQMWNVVGSHRWQPKREIKCCLRVIHECEYMDIPKEFIGGLFLIFLETCEKVVLL